MDVEIKWPVEFDAVPDLSGLAWEETRPGFWQADHAPGMIVIAAVCPTDRQWFASVIPACPPHQLAQLSFTMHDALAERLRVAGWEVGCAGPDCTYSWPCPKREMHDFMGQRNGGELHTPIGTTKKESGAS
ncbi:MAG: hypothetical protein ABW046_22700 [Actinoplanes sp.]